MVQKRKKNTSKSACDCAKAQPFIINKPASFEEPVSETRCHYRFALRCFRGRGCTAAGRSGCNAGKAKKSSLPTCCVTSRIHFDRIIACKIVQSGPLPWQRAVEKWYGPLSWQRAINRRGQRWKDMWEQQSSIRIWAGTRLHPDLGAARLGQDLPGPARILMLDCLYPCWSLRRNQLECTDLVHWTEELHRLRSRDAIVVVGSVLEKLLDGDFTPDQEKEITFINWPPGYQSWKLGLALNGLISAFHDVKNLLQIYYFFVVVFLFCF